MRKQLAAFIGWIRKIEVEKLHYRNINFPYVVTILLALVVVIVGLNLFNDLTRRLFAQELTTLDEEVTEAILSFRRDSVTPIFIFITHLGDRFAYLFISAGIALYFYLKHRSWRFILQTFTVLLLATLSSMFLKNVFSRERPALEHLISVSTLSYPSGHAMTAMAFYGFLIFLVLRNYIHPLLKIFFLFLLVGLILGVGVSRIYLGVHYPSDVIAGYIGGLIWVALCAVIFTVMDLLRLRKTDKYT
jgi:membrane-associated phospholipid phosphatase